MRKIIVYLFIVVFIISNTYADTDPEFTPGVGYSDSPGCLTGKIQFAGHSGKCVSSASTYIIDTTYWDKAHLVATWSEGGTFTLGATYYMTQSGSNCANSYDDEIDRDFIRENAKKNSQVSFYSGRTTSDCGRSCIYSAVLYYKECKDRDGDGFDKFNDCDEIDEEGEVGDVVCPTSPSGCDAFTGVCAICKNPEALEYCDGVNSNCRPYGPGCEDGSIECINIQEIEDKCINPDLNKKLCQMQMSGELNGDVLPNAWVHDKEKSIKACSTDDSCNLCCGDDLPRDWGKIDEINGINYACLADDSDFNTLAGSEKAPTWEWRVPHVKNKYHIYNIRPGNYDIVSNGEDWFKCGDVLEDSSELSVLLPGENPDNLESDPNFKPRAFVSDPTDNPTTDININLKSVSYNGALDGITIKKEDELEVLVDSDLGEINKLEEVVEVVFDGFGTNSNIPKGNMNSNSFICYEENDQNEFIECCGPDTADCKNKNSKDKQRRQGEPLSLITDMNYFKSDSDVSQRQYTKDNKVVLLDITEDIITSGIPFDKIGFFLPLKQDSFLSDWSSYDTLEFYMTFADSERISFGIESKDGMSKNIKNIMDYSVNGHQPMKWHHIIIPLKYFENVDLSSIDDFYFKVFDDYYDISFDPRITRMKSNYYNVFFIDRLFLRNEDYKYCSFDYTYKDDLDDDPVSCMDTPGYFWTLRNGDDPSDDNSKCCGDDQTLDFSETFSGGSYAGCFDGRPVLNGTRIGKIYTEVKQNNQIEEMEDWCFSEKCYLGLKDYAESYELLNVYNNDNSIYDVSFSYDLDKYMNPMYRVSDNSQITTKTSQKIEFLGVPLPLLYDDSQFFGCEIDETDEDLDIVNGVNFCAIKGNYFCSYGDTLYGNKKETPTWSNLVSGFGFASVDATDRDTSKKTFDKMCPVISGDFNGDNIIDKIDHMIFEVWLTDKEEFNFKTLELLNNELPMGTIKRVPIELVDNFNDDEEVDDLDLIYLDEFINNNLENVINNPGIIKNIKCSEIIKDTYVEIKGSNMILNPGMMKNG